MNNCNADDTCNGDPTRPGAARGMCLKHYNRWRRAGNVIPLAEFRVDAEAGVIFGKRGQPAGSRDSSGYLQVTVLIDGRKTLHSAHRWIWTHVHGPIPEGLEVNHRNGIKTDNRITNLEVVTHQANIVHAYRTGLKTNAGEKHPSARLTEAAVRTIRAAAATGAPYLLLAAEHRVSRRTINDIVRRRTWTHLETTS